MTTDSLYREEMSLQVLILAATTNTNDHSQKHNIYTWIATSGDRNFSMPKGFFFHNTTLVPEIASSMQITIVQQCLNQVTGYEPSHWL